MKFLQILWLVSLLLSLPNLANSQSLREFFSNRADLSRDDLPETEDGLEELSFDELICKDKELFPKKTYSKKYENFLINFSSNYSLFSKIPDYGANIEISGTF